MVNGAAKAIFSRRGRFSDNGCEKASMQLRNKITVPMAAIGLVLLAVGVSGAWYVLRLQRLNSAILDQNVASIRAAEEMEIVVREMRHELDRFLFTHDRERLVRALEMEQNVMAWLEQTQHLAVSEREKTLVAETQRGLEEFFIQLRSLDTDRLSADVTATVERLINDLLTKRVLANAREYLDWNEQELQSSNEQNKTMAERLALALLLLGTCGAIAGLVTGYGVALGVSRSILQLTVPIRDVAGKLDDVVGPIEVAANPNVEQLEVVLRGVSAKVGAVVEQLHARHREVIRADQLAAVGQLAAGLAHELRNPLMSMKVLVQSASRRGQTAMLEARDLQVLDEEISRLENLLQAFLDFARPAKLEKKEIDLADVARQTREFLIRRAARRSVSIHCQFPAPIVVEADAAQLKQVILNLLLNALDAVPNGGSIWVEAHADQGKLIDEASDGQNTARVCLRVADNGRGLPDFERNRIYEPFFSKKETGLGLGLAISQRIIHAHGGELIALDREGGGAVLEIWLPAKPICSMSQVS
jgi:signal transduction histidine kinase